MVDIEFGVEVKKQKRLKNEWRNGIPPTDKSVGILPNEL